MIRRSSITSVANVLVDYPRYTVSDTDSGGRRHLRYEFIDN